ncbi:MAG: carboxypeptidase regulatory-like domain-containing protein [Desulfobulbaceae bacterium]|jgi:nickel transport protein|nr:carboxypeptidase regulatory-like domain-containing protein [Desulfobulbaceae bacterium]
MKRIVRFCLLALFVACCWPPTAALAHKVTIFAYTEGDTVYSESYFSDGDPVLGGLVTVADAQGKQVLSGKTDQDGHFHFPMPTPKSDLVLSLDASMGHKAIFTLKLDEAAP